jgi:hypothetical protein
MTTPKLFDIRLPAGDSFGFDVGKKNDNGGRLYNPSDWLSKGYSGVRFIGQGIGITHIRPAQDVWTNIFVLQHDGTVQFENLTLHNGPRSAIQAGTGKSAGLPLFPKFRLVWKGVELDCNVHGMWGSFTYECDTWFEDVSIHASMLGEHPSYEHGYASVGTHWERVVVHSSNGECKKIRPDKEEVRPTPKATAVIRDCTFKNWTSGNRGCSGTTVQGGNLALVLIEKTTYYGGAGSPMCHAIMIDDGEGKANLTNGFPNGHIVLRQVAAQGSSLRTDYGDTLIRVGTLPSSGLKYVARSLTIDRCSLWGQNMAVQLGGLPAGKTVVKDSNTPELRDWANAKNFDTTFEAQIPTAARRVPISEGLAR